LIMYINYSPGPRPLPCFRLNVFHVLKMSHYVACSVVMYAKPSLKPRDTPCRKVHEANPAKSSTCFVARPHPTCTVFLAKAFTEISPSYPFLIFPLQPNLPHRITIRPSTVRRD